MCFSDQILVEQYCLVNSNAVRSQFRITSDMLLASPKRVLVRVAWLTSIGLNYGSYWPIGQ